MLQPIQTGSPLAATGNTVRPPSDVKPVPTAAPVADFAHVAYKHSSADLDNAVADLNKVAQAASQGVRFSLDEESGRTVVKVVDTQTDKVLRQIPTVEALKLWRSIEQMQGVMLRDKA